MNIPLGFHRECEIQRMKDHGAATVEELERAAAWIPIRGYECSADAIAILRRKGFFK